MLSASLDTKCFSFSFNISLHKKFTSGIYLKGYLLCYLESMNLPSEKIIEDYFTLYKNYHESKNSWNDTWNNSTIKSRLLGFKIESLDIFGKMPDLSIFRDVLLLNLFAAIDFYQTWHEVGGQLIGVNI